MLSAKSLTELRGIAQSLDVPDVFQKDHKQLVQAIEMKQKAAVPVVPPTIEQPPYDARLMTAEPNAIVEREAVEEMLQPHIALGLHVTFDQERCYMKCGIKTDEITLRAPLRDILYVARKVLEA